MVSVMGDVLSIIVRYTAKSLIFGMSIPRYRMKQVNPVLSFRWYDLMFCNISPNKELVFEILWVVNSQRNSRPFLWKQCSFLSLSHLKVTFLFAKYVRFKLTLSVACGKNYCIQSTHSSYQMPKQVYTYTHTLALETSRTDRLANRRIGCPADWMRFLIAHLSVGFVFYDISTVPVVYECARI